MSDTFDVTFRGASLDEVHKLVDAVASSGVGEVLIRRSPVQDAVPPGRMVFTTSKSTPESVHAADVTRQFNSHVR